MATPLSGACSTSTMRPREARATAFHDTPTSASAPSASPAPTPAATWTRRTEGHPSGRSPDVQNPLSVDRLDGLLERVGGAEAQLPRGAAAVDHAHVADV